MRCHKTLEVYTDETGAYTEIPGLLTPAGVLEPLLDYFMARSHDLSLSWMGKVARSVRLFLEYMHSNPAENATPIGCSRTSSCRTTGCIYRKIGWIEADWAGPRARPMTPKHYQSSHRLLRPLEKMARSHHQLATRAGPMTDRYEAAYQYRRDCALWVNTFGLQTPPQATGRRVRAQRTPRLNQGEPPGFPGRTLYGPSQPVSVGHVMTTATF